MLSSATLSALAASGSSRYHSVSSAGKDETAAAVAQLDLLHRAPGHVEQRSLDGRPPFSLVVDVSDGRDEDGQEQRQGEDLFPVHSFLR